MTSKKYGLVLFACLCLGLSACYDELKVTLYEPHVYKGKADVHESDATTRANQLQSRFHLVQADR